MQASLVLALLGGACGGDERAPYYQKSRPAPQDGGPGSGGRGASPDSDSNGSDSGGAPNGSGGPAAPSSGNPCNAFDQEAVHLWGPRGLDSLDTSTGVHGIVNELNIARVCRARLGADQPKIRPTDNHVLYRALLYTGADGGVQTSELRLFEHLGRDDSVIELAFEEVPTPGCKGVGISTFHIHPRTGEIFFNCDPETDCRSAVPFMQHRACFAGPWFASDGGLVVEENLYAVGTNDTYLVSGVGFLRLALRVPGSDEKTLVTYDGEVIPPDEADVLARRSHENGFWVVVGAWGGQRRRFFIGEDAVATLEGVYPLGDGEKGTGWVGVGSVVTNWALDAAGNLYESTGTHVVKSELDGEQTLVYDPPPEDAETAIYAGLSGYLVTGP